MSRQARCVFAAVIVACLVYPFHLFAQTFSVSEQAKNLDFPVNSEKNDFAPTVSPDGRFMIFNSNRYGSYQDLFITCFEDGKWSDPEPLAGLNSPYNDETPFLSADGTILLFSSDRDGSIELPKNDRNQIKVSFDIYWSHRVNGRWSSPMPVPGRVNTMHHEKTPSLGRDGKTLYYCMWPFGDMDKTVLLEAEYGNGGFVNPEPMPPPFNTGYRDLALIPAEDLDGFFFASNRPGGMGKFDIYFVPQKDGVFGRPAPLGDKVNSSASEIYLTRADQRYFICSNREGGMGLFDIYSAFVFSVEKSFETRAIYFDFDKAVIKPESFPYLDALSKFLEENEGIDLEIVGHTDLHGADEYNKQLSLERAEAVERYLVKRGLDSRRFAISGVGKSQPVVNRTGEGADELNRRTEFKILKNEKRRKPL